MADVYVDGNVYKNRVTEPTIEDIAPGRVLFYAFNGTLYQMDETGTKTTIGTIITAEGVPVTTLEISGGIPTSVVPDTDNSYDLGSTTHSFKSVHVGGSELNIVGDRLHVDTKGVYTEENITVSTSAPSGGVDGDIWYTVAP